MKHLHIICLSLVLLYGLLGFVSCSSDTAELPREGGDDRDIFLTFQTAVAGASTRADEDNGDDHVGTLRIVIVSKGNEKEAAWKVEHNNTVSPTTALPQMYSFKVAPDSKKRIYLIANGEQLVDAEGNALNFTDNTKFIPEDSGKAPIDDCVFGISEEHPYNSSALPMSAVYEFDVPAADKITDGTYPLPKTLYLVRAATKFSFEFTNQSTERNITVTSIDVEQVITDRMYLMPHVNTNGGGKYWVVEETKAESGSTYAEKVLQDMDWGKWMDGEIERSKRKEDNEWLTDYEIPGGVTTTTHKFTFDPLSMEKSTGEHHPTATTNAFYLPESRTVKAGDNQYKLQEYSITVHTTEGEWELTYPAVTLPHLASLFRNTHVVVSATFTDKEIVYEVDVIPFTPVELTPDMGLERDDFTGYIIGKDEDGKTCWYDHTESLNSPEEMKPLYLGPKGHEGEFVEINDTLYLLVYTDPERTTRSLDHIFKKDPPKKYLLSPEGRTGYVKRSGDVEGVQTEWYQTKLKMYVWLDEGGDPDGNEEEQKVFAALEELGLKLRGRRILYEWDRWDWDKVIGEEKDALVRPKYWYDVLGNRYLWSVGDYANKRKEILKDWADYLTDSDDYLSDPDEEK